MNDAALFEVTVPVFRHYLQRIDAILLKVPREQDVLLQHRLAPHAFTTAEHLDTALDFVSRTLLPLLGFAILRREGVDIGKADFDGQHVYATGFHFQNHGR